MFTQRRVARVLKWLSGLAAVALLGTALVAGTLSNAQQANAATGYRSATCYPTYSGYGVYFHGTSWLNSTGTRTWHLYGVDKVLSQLVPPQSWDFYGARNGRSGSFYTFQELYVSGTDGYITWTGHWRLTVLGSTSDKSCSITL
jgi:hypothetical protein